MGRLLWWGGGVRCSVGVNLSSSMMSLPLREPPPPTHTHTHTRTPPHTHAPGLTPTMRLADKSSFGPYAGNDNEFTPTEDELTSTSPTPTTRAACASQPTAASDPTRKMIMSLPLLKMSYSCETPPHHIDTPTAGFTLTPRLAEYRSFGPYLAFTQ